MLVASRISRRHLWPVNEVLDKRLPPPDLPEEGKTLGGLVPARLDDDHACQAALKRLRA